MLVDEPHFGCEVVLVDVEGEEAADVAWKYGGISQGIMLLGLRWSEWYDRLAYRGLR